MKKLLVVLSVLFVVALLASSAFAVAMYDPEQRAAKLAEVKAAPLRASGEFTFSTIAPIDGSTGAVGLANMYVDLTAYVDDYNSIMIELNGKSKFDLGGGPEAVNTNAGWGDYGSSPIVQAPYWQLATDVGKALDLPIGLVNTAGRTSLYTNKYEVSGLGYERTLVRTNIDPLMWKFAASTDKFQATAAANFGLDNGGRFGVYAFIPAIGPAAVDAWYMAQDGSGKGKVGGSVKATGLLNDMLGVAGGFVYDLVAEGWAYGVGASIKYNILKAGVSLNGNDVDALNQLGIDANAAFTDMFGADAAIGLSFADGADAFQGADLSVYAKIGAAKWSVGYVITENAFAYVPAVAALNGGIYVATDFDF